MKRLVIIFSLLTVSMSLVSCDVLKGWKEKFFSSEDDVVGYEAEPANPYEIRIYANGYDGYVNIRQAPTTKSAVIGRLRNGNDYAVQVGVQGNWITVEYNNTIGYAHNSMVGYSPWPAVNLDVEAEWFQGAYETGYGESPSQFFIYKNGKFAYVFDTEAWYYGTWRLEGEDIILTTKHITFAGQASSHIGQEQRFAVDVRNAAIGGMSREIYRSGSYEYNLFQSCRKMANSLVKF